MLRGRASTRASPGLERRVYEHKHGLVEGFARRYLMKELVYYETTADIRSAIEREKQIKRWTRDKKAALVKSMNPTWRDLSEAWFDTQAPDPSSRPTAAPAGPRWWRGRPA